MKILSLIIITAIASIGIIGFAYAKSNNPDKMLARMTEKLSLNDTQQAHFQAFLDEKIALRSERKARFKAKQSQQDEPQPGPFAKLLEQDKLSTDAINQIIDEMYAERREKQQNVLNSFVVFYNSLSKEQQEKVKPMLRKMLKRSIGRHKAQRDSHFSNPPIQG